MSTIEELLAQITILQTQLQSLQGEGDNNMSCDSFGDANSRIEKYLSDFTNREGVLLTIAGLLSVLPIIGGKESLLYFLTWIYPFLILGITTYIFSAKRINIVSKINESRQFIQANKALKRNYLRVTRLHNLTDLLLVSFFVSFLFNYYLISFNDLPKVGTSVLITILSFLCGIFRYLYISKIDKSDKSADLEMMPVGAALPDILNSPSEKLPESYTMPNPYNIPVHDQGNKKNCTSHAFALMMEYKLSDYFKERTLVDVGDLWGKQKKFGIATEDNGDIMEGPFMIAVKHGIKFKTDSGKSGTVFLSGKKEKKGAINIYKGWRVKLDSK